MWAIRSFETLPSTQVYLVEAVRAGEITGPTAVIAQEQIRGEGSRGHRWEGGSGNFFASIAVPLERLPDDLPPQSASIYFAWLMRETLGELGENVWLKWPNDLYTGHEKVGGVITQKLDRFFVVGIGVNLKENQNTYTSLRTDIPALILLNIYLERLEKFPKWKHLFSKYRVEFEKNRAFFFHHENAKISMKNAMLCNDGSLQIYSERMYSLR